MKWLNHINHIQSRTRRLLNSLIYRKGMEVLQIISSSRKELWKVWIHFSVFFLWHVESKFLCKRHKIMVFHDIILKYNSNIFIWRASIIENTNRQKHWLHLYLISELPHIRMYLAHFPKYHYFHTLHPFANLSKYLIQYNVVLFLYGCYKSKQYSDVSTVHYIRQ